MLETLFSFFLRENETKLSVSPISVSGGEGMGFIIT
jgi:hypothetical protein